jgi:T4 RnlA family RNA ligase
MNWSKFNESVNSHTYYIPTYEECRAICDANENFLFYESKHVVDGYNISIFNYRLAQASNFESPIPENTKIKAHELRGLTFVFNKDGSLYKRFLLMDKFWNMNQTECSMYSVVKDYKIKNIYNKEDGSIASFVQLPNGKVLGKSKTSFESDQAIEIQNIYNTWPNIKQFVDFCFSEDIAPIFEYVSPNNRIVLSYANTDLVLLRMRNNNTGEYLDIKNYVDKLDGISIAQSYDEHTLDNLVELKDVIEGKEGWIVQFENGKMVKIKTQWYNDLHGLFTSELQRENTLLGLILDDKIDDVLAQLGEEATDKRKEVEILTNMINHYITNTSHEVENLLADYKGDRKDFAVKNHKNKFFPIAIGVIDGKDQMTLIKDKIKNDTKDLMKARSWIQKNKI